MAGSDGGRVLGMDAAIAEGTPKPFRRKYSEETIQALRFNYPGISHMQVSRLTGIPYQTVKSIRGYRRRTKTLGKKNQGRVWKDKQGEELRIYFVREAKALFDVYLRVKERLDDEGIYVEPETGDFKQARGAAEADVVLVAPAPAAAVEPRRAPERPQVLPKDEGVRGLSGEGLLRDRYRGP